MSGFQAERPKIEVEDEVVEETGQNGPNGDRQELGGGGGAFSNNPLLTSGKLIRPVWKSKDGEEGVKSEGKQRERRSVWRRVQDDNEDNEQWILDGGLRGYGVETRTMEDGSQQERG